MHLDMINWILRKLGYVKEPEICNILSLLSTAEISSKEIHMLKDFIDKEKVALGEELHLWKATQANIKSTLDKEYYKQLYAYYDKVERDHANFSKLSEKFEYVTDIIMEH